MDLITDPTAVASDPGVPSLTGTRGYFTGGTPGVTPATRVRYWFLNLMMKELYNFISTASFTPDPTNATQVLGAAQSLLGGCGTPVAITTTGSGNFTVPNYVYEIDVEMWGGGAGSLASISGTPSGGAGAGSYCRGRMSVTPGQVIAYTVGAGGNAGTTGTLPTAGGNTTLGAFTAGGGQLGGGTLSNPQAGGVGGAATGGYDNRPGSDGFPGGSIANTGGYGGGAPGGAVRANNGNAASAGYFPGGGASGSGTGSGGTSSYSGAAGAHGQIIIRY